MCTLLLLLFNMQPVEAQNYSHHHKKYVGKFSYEKEGEETVVRAWYHYVVSRTPQGAFILRVFYPETGQITLYTTYADEDLQILNGSASAWYDDGRMIYSGVYEKQRKSGEWQELYGSSSSTGRYQNDLREGPWVIPYKDGRDSGNYVLGKKEGTWIVRDSLDRLKLSRQFKNDELDGEMIAYDLEAGTETRTLYEKGERISGEDSEDGQFTIVETMPCYDKCGLKPDVASCETCLYKFISESIIYPREAVKLDVTGKAMVTFVVDTDGTIKDVVVLNGVCDAIKAECIRLMGLMQPWQPGYQRGKAVKVQYNLPLKFSLR